MEKDVLGWQLRKPTFLGETCTVRTAHGCIAMMGTREQEDLLSKITRYYNQGTRLKWRSIDLKDG